MWKGAAQLILVISVCCTARSELPPSPTSLYLEDDLLASTSPLAQLLASATGATVIGSSPLIFPAITGLKNKRKPLRFKSKGQSRFKPKNLRKKNKAVSEKQPSIKVDDSADIKPRFSSFQKRPSPVLLEPERSTTTQPLLLTDFFGTPEPPVSRNKINPASLITPGKTGQKPFVFDISNDITDGDFSDDLFEKLQTITGAKAIGVTRDRALVGDQRGRERKGSLKSQTKTELSRNEVISEIVTEEDVSDKEQVRKKKERRRGKLSGRRKKVDRVRKKQQEETTESVERQGKAVSFVKASRPPRRKKSNFIRRKRNKARVGTVDRYRYENEDGSITWGYQNDDGSFKVIFTPTNLVENYYHCFPGGDHWCRLHHSWQVWLHRFQWRKEGVLIQQRYQV